MYQINIPYSDEAKRLLTSPPVKKHVAKQSTAPLTGLDLNKMFIYVVVLVMAVVALYSFIGMWSRDHSNAGAHWEDDWVKNLASCADYDDDDQFPSTSPRRECNVYDQKTCNGTSDNTDDRVETAFVSGTMAWALCEVLATRRYHLLLYAFGRL